jgi:mRNA-degrading endonuclease toxin of MazEF toxin-antitoxin module
MRRGTIWNLADEDERHPAIILTRDRLIDVLSNVCVALVTTRVRDVSTQVHLGAENGLTEGCAVNLLNLVTVPKVDLVRYRGELSLVQQLAVDEATRIALQLD